MSQVDTSSYTGEIIKATDLSVDYDINPAWGDKFKAPDESVLIRKGYLDEYWYWIHERQEIWHKRVNLKQPAPWTDDPILRDYKFTHAVRDLDRLTIFYIDNILSKLEDNEQSKKSVLLNTMIFRLFCRDDTWNLFGYIPLEQWDEKWEEAKKALRKRREEGYSIFTSAYYVNDLRGANPDPATRSNKTENAICLIESWKRDIDEIYRKGVKEAKNMKEQLDYFSTLTCVGHFTAYEWACDLAIAKRYTGIEIVPWDDDSDTNVGPGCLRGLKWIFADFGNLTPYQALLFLRSIWKSELKRLGYEDLKLPPKVPGLTLRAVEHSCCELQKYLKAKTGTGRPKVKFTPTTTDVSTLSAR